MRLIDFELHNEEVARVWEAYDAGRPIRVPMTLGINPRLTMEVPEANPTGIQYLQYFNDTDKMLQRQLEHSEWVLFNIPQDFQMGLPKDGWDVNVDLANVYEAGWFGCEVRFYGFQVPDSIPLLKDDSKKCLLFDKGIPDPFESGLMKLNWEHYENFKKKQEQGYTWKGLPINNIAPSGVYTDGPMTVACNLRGAAEFCADLLEAPDYAHQLLDFITTATIERIKAYRQRLGQELIPKGMGFADDSIQLLSTSIYKEMILPYHKRLINELSEGGPNSIHLCGDATRHFPLIAKELNVNGFDTGFPVDFTWLRKTLGPDTYILGGPSVPLLLKATPDEVRDETKRILASGIMEGGRFTLREGNNLAPGTPLENLWAMYDTVKKFGRYD
ncbi:MAG: uroporphyrinogen decarboxylase family protein [bacterium]